MKNDIIDKINSEIYVKQGFLNFKSKCIKISSINTIDVQSEIRYDPFDYSGESYTFNGRHFYNRSYDRIEGTLRDKLEREFKYQASIKNKIIFNNDFEYIITTSNIIKSENELEAIQIKDTLLNLIMPTF